MYYSIALNVLLVFHFLTQPQPLEPSQIFLKITEFTEHQLLKNDLSLHMSRECFN